jgi:uncharacterized protein YjgD (DUF1641 family)
MANPISFKLPPMDPHLELMERLRDAPREHAEALLVAWDLLQTAHDKGLLDLAQGLMGGRDIIAGKLAEAAKDEEAIAALRNAISVGRVLASFDPDVLQKLARSLEAEPMHAEKKTPGIFALIRRALSKDTRQGIGFLLGLVGRIGKSTTRSA